MANNGGSAFPYTNCEDHGISGGYGMTLRDWFAGQALRGACEWDAIINEEKAIFAKEGGVEKLAELAYKIADAMLAERAK